MPRRKLQDRGIRKLTRMGGGRSLGLTIPIEIVKDMKLRERQKVVVRQRGKKIVIEDWKK